MKQLRKPILIILSILFVLTFKSFSQNTEQKDTTDNKLINAAMEIMTAAGTCALITLDEKDLPMVRVMDPFLPESDFTVWFGTNSKSRKVNQIKKNPNVTLYYLDSDASGYVVIHGMAQLVDDQKEKDKRWKDEWEAFYPNKTEDYLLIKVSPEWMEVLSYTHGIVGDPVTWEVPVVFFDSIK
ncbi:MAG: pyridoxamine 5'-phosphate oxidase family protein [Bacteroidetes bacterium]|nr:pyridoxamine 5'-phosphate oxidase family protein [Bacteroidota bacterium]